MPPKQNRSSTVKAGPKPTEKDLADAAASNPSRRVIPLGGGTWCYLVDPVSGRFAHLKVDSPAMDDTLAAQGRLSDAYAQRLRRELSALAYGDFPAALARYDRAAAGDAAEQAA